MTNFALFIYDPYDAGGGLNDLCLIGSLDACIAKAEKQDSYVHFQIVEMTTWRMTKRGGTKYFPLHEETGLSADIGKGSYRVVWWDAWDEVEVEVA